MPAVLGLAAFFGVYGLVRPSPYGVSTVLGILLGLTALPALGVRLWRRRPALLPAGGAVVVGAAVALVLAAAASAQASREESRTEQALARRTAAVQSAGSLLDAAVDRCSTSALAADARTPLRGSVAVARATFERGVRACVTDALPTTSCTGTSCTLTVVLADGSRDEHVVGFSAASEAFTSRRRDAMSDGSFPSVYGDRCTSGEVDPQAPGTSLADC